MTGCWPIRSCRRLSSRSGNEPIRSCSARSPSPAPSPTAGRRSRRRSRTRTPTSRPTCEAGNAIQAQAKLFCCCRQRSGGSGKHGVSLSEQVLLLLSEDTPESICELIGCAAPAGSGADDQTDSSVLRYLLAFVLFKQRGLAFFPADVDPGLRITTFHPASCCMLTRLAGSHQASFWTATMSVQLLFQSVYHRSGFFFLNKPVSR